MCRHSISVHSHGYVLVARLCLHCNFSVEVRPFQPVSSLCLDSAADRKCTVTSSAGGTTLQPRSNVSSQDRELGWPLQR
jgi:hypothetical protein